VWFFLFILALLAAVAIHFAWRQKFRRQQIQLQADIEDFQRRQQQTTTDANYQQQFLFI
jgi:uncharacterized protein YpmS